MKISLCTTFALLATLSALFDFALAVDSNAISPLVKTESQSRVNDERSLQSSRCGCSSCSASVLNRNANGHKVGARIDWLRSNRGMSEQQACTVVCSREFPNVCGACNPSQCGGGGGGPRPSPPSSGGSCGCSSCTSSVLNRDARGHKVGARIDWLRKNRGMSEQQACTTVCSKEFPNVCGACNPGRCGGGGGGPRPSPTPPPPTPPTGGRGGALTVVTQNLFWHILFNQHNGAPFFNVYKRRGLMDIYLFQECPDVRRVRNGLGFSGMADHQFGHGLAVAWNNNRFTMIGQGMQLVAMDRPGFSFEAERFVGWVRLQERSTRKVFFVANHHGPLDINTGGRTGSETVASNIHNAINRNKGSGDIVILAGDINADAASRTIRSLQSKGYRRRASDWVDHILTKDGLNSSSQVSIIHGAGSDHRGVSVRWSSS